MNQIETGLVKLGLWAFGIMFTAIFLMVSLTYKSQLDTAKLISDHISTQMPADQYVVHRFRLDSLAILDLQSDNSKFKTMLRKLDPEVFVDEFYDEESFLLMNKSQAILNKNDYSLKNLTQ